MLYYYWRNNAIVIRLQIKHILALIVISRGVWRRHFPVSESRCSVLQCPQLIFLGGGFLLGTTFGAFILKVPHSSACHSGESPKDDSVFGA